MLYLGRRAVIKDCMKRDIVSLPATASIREAAALVADRHIGLVPIVGAGGLLVGVVGLPELLSLELPSFLDLISNVDFVNDFGAVESEFLTPEQLALPVTSLMRPATVVKEESGLLRAYALMIKHNLSDLPVVSASGQLVGLVSRVDIGAAILSNWKEIKETGA